MEVPNWKEYFSAVGQFVCKVTKEKLANYSLDTVLEPFLRIQAEELKLLKLLRQDTRSLIEGPYNSAFIHLRDAGKPHRTPQEQTELLTKAKDKFVDALGQERDSFRRIMIMSHLGNTWALLKKKEDAKDWYSEAYQAGINLLQSRLESVEQKELLYGVVSGGSLLGTVGGIVGSFFFPPLSVVVLGCFFGGGPATSAAEKNVAKAYGEQILPLVELLESFRKLQSETPEFKLTLAELPIGPYEAYRRANPEPKTFKPLTNRYGSR